MVSEENIPLRVPGFAPSVITKRILEPTKAKDLLTKDVEEAHHVPSHADVPTLERALEKNDGRKPPWLVLADTRLECGCR